MTIEEENKYLEQLARSGNMSEAVKQYFERGIKSFTDARNYKSDDFEIEGKSFIKAAILLEAFLRKLELLAKPKKERQKNPYI